MSRDTVWSILFSLAIAVLMLAILVARNVTPPLWVLISYPAIGAVLAQVASRTCPNRRQIAWLETGSIAAACVVVLVALVNMLLVELFVTTAYADGPAAGRIAGDISYVLLPVISVLLWWSLERRIKRLRSESLNDAVEVVGGGFGRSPGHPRGDRREQDSASKTVRGEFQKHAT